MSFEAAEREREREKLLPLVSRCRGKIPRLKRLMAALRIQDPANDSFFFRREAREIGIYTPINDTTPGINILFVARQISTL